MTIALEYEGVKGNCTAEGYEDHITCLSVQFGVGRGISMEPGNCSNRESTRPTITEITLTKEADSSCTSLFKDAVTGNKGTKAVLKFLRTGSDKIDEFMSYTLENCMISNYSISAEADTPPYETICLSFTKIVVNYNDSDASNAGGSPQRVGYDLELAKPL
ncbi:MAG: type VI secretion system tube protein Hcp [Gammaproteobacteria bacterium]|nr:type VI secretion system tube protein Hcp [Gammaproteobacteria bacterium]